MIVGGNPAVWGPTDNGIQQHFLPHNTAVEITPEHDDFLIRYTNEFGNGNYGSYLNAKWETCPAELNEPIEQIRWPNDGIPSIPGIYTIKVTYYK